MTLLTLPHRAALRLPGLRWAPCGLVGPRKRSATGHDSAEAAMPGGTAFARPTVGTVRVGR
ncbi:hypothetical protein, partial [Pseudescherichia sp.]|uniref:hypothetical protein n=1 Tax=Pseudescherichia sp. TaxID=2055881 RepID=UPI0028AEC566